MRLLTDHIAPLRLLTDHIAVLVDNCGSQITKICSPWKPPFLSYRQVPPWNHSATVPSTVNMNVQLHGPLQEEGVASRLRDVQVHGTRWRGEHHAHPGTGAICMCMPFYLASFVRQVNSEENSNKPSLKCHEESCGCAVLTQSSQYHANQHAGWHLRQSATNVTRSKKRASSGGQNIASMFKKSRPSTPCPTPITAATASAPPGRI